MVITRVVFVVTGLQQIGYVAPGVDACLRKSLRATLRGRRFWARLFSGTLEGFDVESTSAQRLRALNKHRNAMGLPPHRIISILPLFRVLLAPTQRCGMTFRGSTKNHPR